MMRTAHVVHRRINLARAVVTAAALLALVPPWAALAQADAEPTAMSMSVPATAVLGERVILQARLIDSSGAPIANAPVFFTSPMSFLNASGDVVLAVAKTDKDGLAVAEHEVRNAGQLTIQAAFFCGPDLPGDLQAHGPLPRSEDHYGGVHHAPAKVSAQMRVAEAPRQLYVQHAGVRVPGLNSAPALGPTMLSTEHAVGPLAGASALWPAMSVWPIVGALLVIWSSYAFVVLMTFRVASASAMTTITPVDARRRMPAPALDFGPTGGRVVWSGVIAATTIVALVFVAMVGLRGLSHTMADLAIRWPYLTLVALGGGTLVGLVARAAPLGTGHHAATALGGLGVVVALGALLSCCLWALAYQVPLVSSLVLALVLNEVPVTLAGMALSVLGLLGLVQLPRPAQRTGVRP